MERTPRASSSLSVCAKNPTNFGLWQTVCEPLVDGAAQVRSPSTHTRIWFANRLRAVCESFGTLKYTRLKMQHEQAIAFSIYTSAASKNANMQRVKTPVKTPLTPQLVAQLVKVPRQGNSRTRDKKTEFQFWSHVGQKDRFVIFGRGAPKTQNK